MEKLKPTNTNKRPLPPVAHWVLAGVALGSAYAAASGAVDNGSLLLYAAALVLVGLGIKQLIEGFGLLRKK